MKIAILSDIHDNVWKLMAALKQMQDAERLICCGDLCSPFIVSLLAEGFQQGALYIVFGNNDADQFRITQNANRYPNQVTLHGAFGEFRFILLSDCAGLGDPGRGGLERRVGNVASGAACRRDGGAVA